MLLLDDIFDKLDDLRIKKLMQMVSEDDFGQLFITDTSAERVKNIFEQIDVDLRVFHINESVVNHE